MDGFIVFISVIVAVLNIILFFKLLIMTDDVKKLRKKFYGEPTTPLNDQFEIARLKTLGREEEAIEFLNNRLEHLLIQSIRDRYNKPWSASLEKVKPLYDYLGAKVPEKYLNFDMDAYYKEASKI